jgi:hypothetical protein
LQRDSAQASCRQPRLEGQGGLDFRRLRAPCSKQGQGYPRVLQLDEWTETERVRACCACRQQRQFFPLGNLNTVDETSNSLSWLLALRNRSSWRVSRHDWSVCWPTGGPGSDKQSFVSVMEIPTLGNTAATTPWACSPDRG